MCTWGDHIEVKVPQPFADGTVSVKTVKVDRCLESLLMALNNAGFYTKQSCCGHGKLSGGIMLHDGTYILLTRTEKFLHHANMIAKMLDGDDFIDRFPEHLHCECDVCAAYRGRIF